MKKREFRELLEGVHEKLLDLTETKGEEYSNDDDQLANFKRSAADSGATKYQVWLVFFNKHLDAIKYFVKNGKVKSTEGLIGRIDDAILYLMLLRAMHIEDLSDENASTAEPLAVNSDSINTVNDAEEPPRVGTFSDE